MKLAARHEQNRVNRLLKMLEPIFPATSAAFSMRKTARAGKKAESVNSSWNYRDLSVDGRDLISSALSAKVLQRVSNGANVVETQIKGQITADGFADNDLRWQKNNYRTGFTFQNTAPKQLTARANRRFLLSDERTAETETAATLSENRPKQHCSYR